MSERSKACGMSRVTHSTVCRSRFGPEFCFKLKDRQRCVLLCGLPLAAADAEGTVLRRLQLYRYPLFVVQSINIFNKNEDQLCFAPCLRRLCRRLCPPGFQQGATCRKFLRGRRRRRQMRKSGNMSWVPSIGGPSSDRPAGYVVKRNGVDGKVNWEMEGAYTCTFGTWRCWCKVQH